MPGSSVPILSDRRGEESVVFVPIPLCSVSVSDPQGRHSVLTVTRSEHRLYMLTIARAAPERDTSLGHYRYTLGVSFINLPLTG